jgi:DnaJ-class molecular chaperone
MNNNNNHETEFDYFGYQFDDDITCDFCGHDPCECFDDICCYDPRYTGAPGTCRCADYEKAERRGTRWYDKFKLKFWDLYFGIKDKIRRWPLKTTCGQCGEESLIRKWNGKICPKCGKEDLPF